jgi:peptidoglycan hydrolase-like protein with peptidoglycan-binding domain
MKRKILVSAVTICALSGAGIAFAEGTSGQQKPEHEQTMQEQRTEATPERAPEKKVIKGEKAATERAARLDSVRIKALDEDSATKLQQKLAELGYYRADVDGKFGPRSRAALSQFFSDQSKLVAQGRVADIAMLSLGLDDTDVERVRGIDRGEAEEQREPTRGTEKVEPTMEPHETEDMP